MLPLLRHLAPLSVLGAVFALVVSGCGGSCPTAADRETGVLLDVEGTIGPGEEQAWVINNGILSGNLYIVVTWADSSVSLTLVTEAMDCDPSTNGACFEGPWYPTGDSDYEITVDASSVPKYRLTLIGDSANESLFHLTVTYVQAICT